MGNEGVGMRQKVKESCDFLVTIPSGVEDSSVDSLNVRYTEMRLYYEVIVIVFFFHCLTPFPSHCHSSLNSAKIDIL